MFDMVNAGLSGAFTGGNEENGLSQFFSRWLDAADRGRAYGMDIQADVNKSNAMAATLANQGNSNMQQQMNSTNDILKSGVTNMDTRMQLMERQCNMYPIGSPMYDQCRANFQATQGGMNQSQTQAVPLQTSTSLANPPLTASTVLGGYGGY